MRTISKNVLLSFGFCAFFATVDVAFAQNNNVSNSCKTIPTAAAKGSLVQGCVVNIWDVSIWGISDREVENLGDVAILKKINFTQNRQKIEAAANAGDTNAMYFLGLNAGSGATGSADKARIWFKKAAALNNKYALFALGFEIMGSAQNVKQAAPAIQYYEKAANLGHLEAMVELGRIYNKGTELPIPRDVAYSMMYYDMAIKGGSEQAKIDVAYAYLEGQGVRQDKNKAKQMLIEIGRADTEIGELARNSLLEEFNIDCPKNPNQCK